MQEKNSMKMKEKNRLETKEKRAKLNDKIQKTIRRCFAENEFDWTTWQNFKKAARKHRKPWKSARKPQKLN